MRDAMRKVIRLLDDAIGELGNISRALVAPGHGCYSGQPRTKGYQIETTAPEVPDAAE
jgi:hypothetical protein